MQLLPRSVLLTMLSLGLAGGHAEAAPSTTITVSGQVGTPGTYGPSQLQALPQVTQTDSYTAAGAPVTDTYTGPTLSSLLAAAGGIQSGPTVKNDVLRQYVVATGSDGYEAVVSAGEIASSYGNKPVLVGIADTGGTLPSSAGVARLTVPGDVAGGRYVSNLTSLQVGTAPAVGGTGGGVETSLQVQGGVVTPSTVTAATLEALTPYTETVTYRSGSTSVTDTYTGALLWDVLSAAGIVVDPTVKNDVLRKLVSVTGSDGYQVDLSLGELDPAFGDEPILLAYADTDGQLAGGDGFARLVVPGDTVGGRYVSNVASLTVLDPTVTVPEPASMGLVLVGGIVVLGLRRRGRALARS